MKNKDKDIKQKVAEYMEIMGIYAPEEDKEASAGPEETSAATTEGGE